MNTIATPKPLNEAQREEHEAILAEIRAEPMAAHLASRRAKLRGKALATFDEQYEGRCKCLAHARWLANK